MIIITATIPTKSDNREDIVRLCIEHSNRSRKEPGCISHHIHSDCEDPSRLFYHEEWEDEAAVAAHFMLLESQGFVGELSALVGERPDMQIYRTERASV